MISDRAFNEVFCQLALIKHIRHFLCLVTQKMSDTLIHIHNHVKKMLCEKFCVFLFLLLLHTYIFLQPRSQKHFQWHELFKFPMQCTIIAIYYLHINTLSDSWVPIQHANSGRNVISECSPYASS